MSLNKEQILANASKFRREQVEVPEWGGTVWVREMAAEERDQWEGWMVSKTGMDKFKNLRALIVSLAVCDEAGNRLFSDAEISQVGKLPVSGIDRVFEAASKLNRLTKGDVEELEKN
jgi:hypothetical protein